MKTMNSLTLVVFSTTMLMSFSAFAETAGGGICKGRTESGQTIHINYYTNPFDADAGSLFYAKIALGNKIATYDLNTPDVLDDQHFHTLVGPASKKSQEAGVDFGKAKLELSEDHLQMRGSLGSERFDELKCVYTPIGN